MNKQDMTPGQKRVRCSFNPNALPIVECIKAQTATLMDTLDLYAEGVRMATPNTPETQKEAGDFFREIATAKTEIQGASMWAVGAVTHSVALESVEGKIPKASEPNRWISYKDWALYNQWKAGLQDQVVAKLAKEATEKNQEQK